MIQLVYTNLFKSYNFQNWWPVTPIGKLEPEYTGGPKDRKQQLEVIFGAILTQNTQWKPNVERAIIELNKKNLIDIDRILKVKHEELAQLIKSSGYFNQKAKKLKNIAVFLKETPIEKLEQSEPAELRNKLLAVNGIGPETADSIILYAFSKPIFVIDAYTKRIFSRLGLCSKEISYDELQIMFHDNLEKDARLFNEYHALIVEHAKRYCRKKPVCGKCVIRSECKYKNRTEDKII
ncbi:endonuclease [Candidatus Woesearchaeota archaeon]|nr:endonuclease [Candidatus Woesearchaeota archaeon]